MLFHQGKFFTIGNESRPTQMHDWLQIGHKWEAIPDINAEIVDKYAADWWSWWKNLQPKWRKTNLSWEVLTGGSDWGNTRKGSQNGCFIVILALGWWFLGVHNNDGCGINNCEHALTDVA